MKLVLGMTLVMFSTVNAYAACSLTSAGDCKTKSECESLNTSAVAPGNRVEWRVSATPSAGSCMKVQVEGEMDCLSVSNQKDKDMGTSAQPEKTGSAKSR